MIKNDFKNVIFHTMTVNEGFGRANNVAMHASTGEYILLLKADNALRRVANPALQTEFEVDREKVNTAAENKLNESDLKILTELCRQPTIANKDIAEQVYLSLEGVKSSFKKMYDLFDITASSRNKKLALAIRVMTLSEASNSQ